MTLSTAAKSVFAEIAVSEMGSWVGGGNAEQVGIQNRNITKLLTRMSSHARVLDFGCGIGRTAAAILGDPGFSGNVVGVDIVPKMIRFCKSVIGARFPNSDFICTDARNIQYDRFKDSDSTPVTEAGFFAENKGKFDISVAFSVFTHLSEDVASRTFVNLASVLRPGGSLVISALILDDESRHAFENGMTSFQLPRLPTKYDEFFATPDLRLVAFSWQRLSEMAAKAGLYVSAAAFGSWRGKPPAPGMRSFQDVVCLGLKSTLPDGFDPETYVNLHPDLQAAGVNGKQHYLTSGFYEGRKWK